MPWNSGMMMGGNAVYSGPVFKTYATNQSVSGSTSQAITTPSGIVGGATPDTLIAVAWINQNTTMTGPTGWSEITTTPSNFFHVFRKVATGSEGGSQTFTLGTSGIGNFGMFRFSGANATTPVDTTSWSAGAGYSFLGNATFATNVMTVASVTAGAISVGDLVNANHSVFPANTYVSSFGTGTGGTGTYNLSTSPGTISSVQVVTSPPNSPSSPSVTPAGANELLLTVYMMGATYGTNNLTSTLDAALTKITDGPQSGSTFGNFTVGYKQLTSAGATGSFNATPNYASKVASPDGRAALSILIKK